MKNILLVTILTFAFISCYNARNENLNSIIIGHIKGIPTDKVFLTDAYNAKKILDSADYINNTFTFKYQQNKDSGSLLVSLRFFNNNTNKRNIILVKNKFANGNGSSAFVLEKGKTVISGEILGIENNGTNIMDIESGKQNDVFFKMQNKGFGFLNKSDKKNRDNEINLFKLKIKEYPFSYYLLQEIISNKETYTKNELSDILKKFNTGVQNSSNGKKLKSYINSEDNRVSNFSKFSFSSSRGMNIKLIDTSSKINMIVLWASWCAPCREEIPILKEINKEYVGKKIRITSISIDTDTTSWRKTLNVESMSWQQLISINYNLDSFKTAFSFSSIPVIILTNNHGDEIYRLSNLTSEEVIKCKKIFDSYLTN